MTLKNKISAITAAAMLAFTGVGFAAWTFTNEQSASISTITSKVSVGIELNDGFTLHNASGNAEVTSLYLICDAPAGQSGVLAGNGVYWATDAAGANAITNVYMKGTLKKVAEDGILDKATVTVSFAASHNLTSTYITFGTFGAITDVSDISTEDNTPVQSGNIALPTLSYSSVPTSTSELTTMRTTVASEVVGKSLTFTAHISA